MMQTGGRPDAYKNVITEPQGRKHGHEINPAFDDPGQRLAVKIRIKSESIHITVWLPCKSTPARS